MDIITHLDSIANKHYADLFDTMTDLDLSRWTDSANEQVKKCLQELPDDQKWFHLCWASDVKRGRKELERRRKRLFFLANPSFSKDTIDAIKETTSMVDILLAFGYTPHKSGSVHKMLCPFHNDVNASFVIYNDRRFHCFGCSKQGDVIDLVKELRKFDFVDTIRFLGERMGVEIK